MTRECHFELVEKSDAVGVIPNAYEEPQGSERGINRLTPLIGFLHFGRNDR